MKFLLIFFLLIGSLLADRDGGPYLGFGYGTSIYNDDGLNQKLIEEDSNSMIFYAGAYINKHLSVELGYIDFNTNGSNFIALNDSINNISISTTTISTLAHYQFFNDKLDFYGKFGAGELNQSGIKTEGFTLVYGVGAGYRFNKSIGVKIAYDNYQFNYDENSDDVADYRMKIDSFYAAIEVQF